MAQDFVTAAYDWLLGITAVLIRLAPWIVIAVALGFAIWLAFRKLDPDGYFVARPVYQRLGARARLLALLGIATTLLVASLTVGGQMVRSRREVIAQASASKHRDPHLSGIQQYAPAVAVVEEKTYTRTITLPSYLVERVSAEGLQVLAPYLTDPSAENVTKMVDSFKRSGQDVVFSRQVTRRDETAVAAEAADVSLKFANAGSSSARSNYEVESISEYRFKNPREQEATMRFAYPIPEGGGTIQEFYLEVGGKRISDIDENSQLVWEQAVPAGGEVVAKAHYRASGAARFSYILGSERRRIGDFHLASTSELNASYAKEAIFPNTLSGNNAEWRLKDVLTRQSIAIAFPRADVAGELVDKTIALGGLILPLLALALAWISPKRALGAAVLFGIGMLALPVLASYLPGFAAILLSVLAAGGLAAWYCSEVRERLLIGIAGLSLLVFLSVEHGSLALWIIAVAASVLAFWRRQTPFSTTVSHLEPGE